MKLSASLVFASTLLSSAFAAPASSIVTRDVQDTLSYKFTLAALNKILPNANSTGVPLVLGSAGAIVGERLEVTSTYASYPYNDFPSLALVSGSLRAFDAGGNWNTNATSMTISGYGDSSSNEPLQWLTTSLPTTYLSTQYSVEVESGATLPKLAALGRADLWSLCPFGHESYSQTSLVFNVTADATGVGFVPSECRAVTVNVVAI